MKRSSWFYGIRTRYLLSRALYTLGLDIAFLAVFGALFLIMRAAYGGRVTWIHGTTILPALGLLALLSFSFAIRLPALVRGEASARAAFVRSALRMTRDWLPLILILLVYTNFRQMTYLLRPTTVDATLRRIDHTLFSVEPALALQPFVRPWLTEYMSLCYALFFAFPTVILVRLYRRGDFVLFREFGLVLSLGFYLALIGYMLVPAVGPRYVMTHELTVPLEGYWLTRQAALAWRSIESVERDCFPSMHTAVSAMALIYLYRLRRRWRGGRALLGVCAPLIVSLWASTIYLRYHYGIDVLAGGLLALFCSRVAPRLVRWYYDERRPWVPQMAVRTRFCSAHSRQTGCM